MCVAQEGIFALGPGSHSYLAFDLLEHAEPLALVQAIANLREPSTTTGGVNLVAGFRSSLWTRVAPEDAPIGVVDFLFCASGRVLAQFCHRRRRMSQNCQRWILQCLLWSW